MKTYKELQAEIKSLQAQAEKAREAELANAIAEIKEKIREYGITESDLFGTTSKKKPIAQSKGVKPKYRNPETGETWTGRGKSPKWISGKDRTLYQI